MGKAMLIEPVNEVKADAIRRVRAAPGLFAWGRPAVTGKWRIAAWAECAVIFFLMPFIAILAEVRLFVPFTILFMLSAAVTLLSMTRNFHWRDLTPVDAISEWRLVLGLFGAFAAVAVGSSMMIGHEISAAAALGLAPMLLAFPFLTALPMELVNRVLFFRRFGHLFPNEGSALIFGAASNALVYFMLAGTTSSALFGALIGVCVGWVYLRTGQFLISVLVHWLAALCIFALGPGLLLL